MASFDEILKLHEGGKLYSAPKSVPETRKDLQMIYTPGVADVCMHIKNSPSEYKKYTMGSRTVAIVTNGTAILGLGNIGVKAGMPVMEGKAVLLKHWGGVNAWPILVDSEDPDVIVDVVTAIHKGYGAIMLEDIASPVCFIVENKLRKALPIPVFHDDQHGTACVVMAALIRALRLVKKKKEDIYIAVSGAGAAGTAIALLLHNNGFAHRKIKMFDRHGVLYRGRPNSSPHVRELCEQLDMDGDSGTLESLIHEADVFIGVSVAGLVTKEMVKSMKKDAIVFGLANPVGEITVPDALEAGAAIAADGKMVNNCNGFPGLFRGALDAGARSITTKMIVAAAYKLADLAALEGATALMPDFMKPEMHIEVAKAVAKAWKKDPVPEYCCDRLSF